jgi:hypothetical protein
MMKHTPGPWFVLDNRADGGGPTVLVHSGTGDVAEVYGFFVARGGSPPPDDFGVPNARLIAAAPELLDELHAQRALLRDLLGESMQAGATMAIGNAIERIDAVLVKALV